MKYFIGIDNGVTGAICALDQNGLVLHHSVTPVQKTLNYTKAKEYVNRVVLKTLASILGQFPGATVILERPMINPQRWKASVSAIRCDEATRGVIEALNLRLVYVDSKEWQNDMLPTRKAIPRATKKSTPAEKAKLKAARSKYTSETKELSLAVGERLFPTLKFKKDADAALIAEWARRANL